MAQSSLSEVVKAIDSILGRLETNQRKKSQEILYSCRLNEIIREEYPPFINGESVALPHLRHVSKTHSDRKSTKLKRNLDAMLLSHSDESLTEDLPSKGSKVKDVLTCSIWTDEEVYATAMSDIYSKEVEEMTNDPNFPASCCQREYTRDILICDFKQRTRLS